MHIKNYNLGNYIVPSDTKGGVCLEIGANVGSFTKKYQNHFSKLHYYEPLTECFNIIQSNTNSENIQGFNLAGFSKSGEILNMVLHKNKDSGSTGLKTDALNNDWDEEIYQKIETISLEDMIKNLETDQIDYCKSDCETAEYYIFLGKDLTSINYLGLEMHHQMGIKKWNELINHINITHKLISGDKEYSSGKNKDLLFQRFSL